MQLISEKAIHGDYRLGSMNHPTHVVLNGDLWCIFNGGGGGYGDVLERDPVMVMDDLRKEIISHRTAAAVYRVAYNPEALEVDHAKTDEWRQKEREDRKARGLTWEDFEKEWSRLHPAEEAMDYYGSWPDARKIKEIIRM
jgi:hypothetical protein